MALTFDVETQGVANLLDRLQGFEPEVYKILQRDIKAGIDIVASSARGLLPGFALDNWGPWEAGRLDYYGPAVASSIKPRMRTRRLGGQRYVMGLVDTKSPAGNVYALAGFKTKSGPFNEYLNSKWGESFPRALGPAWNMHVEEAREAIQTAIDDAARKVA